MCHDDQGHFALDKTLEKVRENYWFSGMSRFVSKANGQCERVNRTLLNSLAATSAGSPEDKWDQYVKQVQSAINNAINRTIQKSAAQLLYGFKPCSVADSALIAGIQASLDQVGLRELRKEAKRAMDAEQVRQKAQFDAKRCKAPRYDVGDVVMVAANLAATGQSRKLVVKAKGPFKVTAVLPNDRYEVRLRKENTVGVGVEVDRREAKVRPY
ncbi:uncharacterized protein LOC105694320 [Orussus abietinus]|uniref:uncharacterized protein LOC105694320 n=1 Tax=Orussus abietinus TaxID=222816 RepID=UPI000625F5B9|nr:uncharacterized protein LOC105694320 [Orussus abietinus]